MILFFMIDIDWKELIDKQYNGILSNDLRKSYAVPGCGKLWLSLRSIFLSKMYEVTYCIMRTCNSQKPGNRVRELGGGGGDPGQNIPWR